MNKKYTFLILMNGLYISNGYAQSVIYGGLATGYSVISGLNYSDSPEGGQFPFNGNMTYTLGRWVFDGGVGWFYSNLSGRSNSNQSVQIIHREGLLELSPPLVRSMRA